MCIYIYIYIYIHGVASQRAPARGHAGAHAWRHENMQGHTRTRIYVKRATELKPSHHATSCWHRFSAENKRIRCLCLYNP